MRRIRTMLGMALVAGCLVTATSVVAAPAATTLKGTVGPGFTITLTKGGKKVKSLKAGKYKIVISDRSAIHNFHLRGRGVDEKTSISRKGKTSWTVRLRKGTYRYQCDPHATEMHGSFKVK